MTPQPRPRRTLTALLIPVAEPPRLAYLPRSVTPQVRAVNALIDGLADALDLTSRWTARVDDNGIASDKPVNPAGSVLARAYGREFRLYGPVVVTGRRETDYDIHATSLSPREIGIILSRLTLPAR